MIAEELMTQKPKTVPTNAKVRDALHLLQSLDIRHLPVVNEAKELVGMLSDRDLRSARLPPEAEGNVSVLDMRVSEVMSADPLSVSPDTDVGELIDHLVEHKVGAVPVVDAESGELVGIVSYIDVLRTLRGLVAEEG
ncbi:MAG: CBS domain-containing protein [Deltaproteobacteria bacterium]|jgi:CBS domain-containing protein|nr:CBS domain-containing protein [Deltaproteobacteria bacterium]